MKIAVTNVLLFLQVGLPYCYFKFIYLFYNFSISFLVEIFKVTHVFCCRAVPSSQASGGYLP